MTWDQGFTRQIPGKKPHAGDKNNGISHRARMEGVRIFLGNVATSPFYSCCSAGSTCKAKMLR